MSDFGRLVRLVVGIALLILALLYGALGATGLALSTSDRSIVPWYVATIALVAGYFAWKRAKGLLFGARQSARS